MFAQRQATESMGLEVESIIIRIARILDGIQYSRGFVMKLNSGIPELLAFEVCIYFLSTMQSLSLSNFIWMLMTFPILQIIAGYNGT